MNRPENHDPLRELLSDAVSDVEPDDALVSIRNRTRQRTSSSRRPWLLGAGGAVVATAATITAIAFVGNLGNDHSAGPGPATSPSGQVSLPSGTSEPTGGPDDSETTAPNGGGKDFAVPVYYLGDGPRGTRLFREFHSLSEDDGFDDLTGALHEALSIQPSDPDYRNPWPAGTALGNATYDGEVITVDLSTGATDLNGRPAGLAKDDAAMAVEQLIYTAQAGAADGRKPVQFLVDGSHTDTLLGVPAAEPLANAEVDKTLSLMNITAPREGVEVSGVFTATGVNNGPEAWVGWQLLDADGKVVDDGFGTADGWMDPNRLFPWRVEVDLSDVAPGTYTFRAYNDDPSGGAEGHGPDADTRTVIVK